MGAAVVSAMTLYSGPIFLVIIGLSMGLVMSCGAWHLITKIHTLSGTMRFMLGRLAFGVFFLAFVTSEQLFETQIIFVNELRVRPQDVLVSLDGSCRCDDPVSIKTELEGRSWEWGKMNDPYH